MDKFLRLSLVLQAIGYVLDNYEQYSKTAKPVIAKADFQNAWNAINKVRNETKSVTRRVLMAVESMEDVDPAEKQAADCLEEQGDQIVKEGEPKGWNPPS